MNQAPESVTASAATATEDAGRIQEDPANRLDELFARFAGFGAAYYTSTFRYMMRAPGIASP